LSCITGFDCRSGPSHPSVEIVAVAPGAGSSALLRRLILQLQRGSTFSGFEIPGRWLPNLILHLRWREGRRLDTSWLLADYYSRPDWFAHDAVGLSSYLTYRAVGISVFDVIGHERRFRLHGDGSSRFCALRFAFLILPARANTARLGARDQRVARGFHPGAARRNLARLDFGRIGRFDQRRCFIVEGGSWRPSQRSRVARTFLPGATCPRWQTPAEIVRASGAFLTCLRVSTTAGS
jgi:hypothetical protein